MSRGFSKKGEFYEIEGAAQVQKNSQLKLAMDLNMNQNAISRYENGMREADYKTLIAFADYFNVSLDYLLERTNDTTFLKS